MALISKHAELAGLIEHHQKKMGRLADDLAHLDATLKLSSPGNRPADDPGQGPPDAEPLLPPGGMPDHGSDIFREAQGAALSSRQIGEAQMARRPLEPTTLTI